MRLERIEKLRKKFGPLKEVAGTAQDYLEKYGAPVELIRAWNRKDERDRFHAEVVFATERMNLRGRASSRNPNRAALLAAKNALLRLFPELGPLSAVPIENGFEMTGVNMRFVTMLEDTTPTEALVEGCMFATQQVMVNRRLKFSERR